MILLPVLLVLKKTQKILPSVLQYAQNFSGEILFTKDTHQPNYLESREGKKLPIVHCVEKTLGWELAAPLEEFCKSQQCPVFCKETFGSIQLAQYLLTENEKEIIDEIQLIGVCTDICVISNAFTLRSFLPETPICVVASCWWLALHLRATKPHLMQWPDAKLIFFISLMSFLFTSLWRLSTF